MTYRSDLSARVYSASDADDPDKVQVESERLSKENPGGRPVEAMNSSGRLRALERRMEMLSRGKEVWR